MIYSDRFRGRRDSGRGRGDSGRGRGRDRGDTRRGKMASSVSSTEGYFEGYVYSIDRTDYPVSPPEDMDDGICLVYFEGEKPNRVRKNEFIIKFY